MPTLLIRLCDNVSVIRLCQLCLSQQVFSKLKYYRWCPHIFIFTCQHYIPSALCSKFHALYYSLALDTCYFSIHLHTVTSFVLFSWFDILPCILLPVPLQHFFLSLTLWFGEQHNLLAWTNEFPSRHRWRFGWGLQLACTGSRQQDNMAVQQG